MESHNEADEAHDGEAPDRSAPHRRDSLDGIIASADDLSEGDFAGAITVIERGVNARLPAAQMRLLEECVSKATKISRATLRAFTDQNLNTVDGFGHIGTVVRAAEYVLNRLEADYPVVVTTEGSLHAFTAKVGPQGALASMIDELQTDGARELRRRLRFHVPIGRAGIVDEGIAELTFAPTEGVIRSDSTFHMNPQRALARELAASAEPTIDDSDNFLGWENYQREDLAALEGQIIGGAVARLAERMNHSLAPGAGASWIEFRLKAAELATHLHVRDAVEAVRWLQRSALPGALVAEHDVYRTNCTWPEEGPTVRWWLTRRGFTVKVYAKTRTLVRIEVSAADRAQIIKLGCGLSRNDIGEADARALISDFREKAGTVLASAVRHVVAALASTTSIWELQVALLPLTRLAAGEAMATGRPPGEGGIEAAREALEAIFGCGLHVCQHRKEHAIRACLDALAAPGGPLVREGRRSAYTLAPRFAHTADALVRAHARRRTA